MRLTALASALALFSVSTVAAAADPVASSKAIVFHPEQKAVAYQLRVVGPNGSAFEDLYMSDEPMTVPYERMPSGWSEGIYHYEIVPIRGMRLRSEAQAGGSAVALTTAAGESGTFRVEDGTVHVASAQEEGDVTMHKALSDGITTMDQVIVDDLIVTGSGCVGIDCVNGENFDFDTLRLKENNLRIKFEDTSAGAFPSNDWQLTANDAASGGADRFSIDDVTNATTPFTVIAKAPSNSLYIGSTGRVGFGTSTPVLPLHVMGSDTPGLRMEQTGAGGYTPQTWDVAGNEANFFVRDVTGGSRLPFRISPGAPTSSIDIKATGDVGIGTTTPTANLDVSRAGDVTVRLSNTSGSGVTTDWELRNNVATGRFTLSDDPARVRVPLKVAPNATDNLLRLGVLASNTVDIKGNLVVTGTITPDYVFDDGFDLPSIREHAQFMWKNRHLPKLAPAQVNENGEGVIDVGSRSQGVLEELEYAHIYIEQIHTSVEALKDGLAKKGTELAELRAELAAIRAELGQ